MRVRPTRLRRKMGARTEEPDGVEHHDAGAQVPVCRTPLSRRRGEFDFYWRRDKRDGLRDNRRRRQTRLGPSLTDDRCGRAGREQTSLDPLADDPCANNRWRAQPGMATPEVCAHEASH